MKFNLILSILMCNFVQHLIIKTIRHVWLCLVFHQNTKKDEMYMCRIKEIYLCSMGAMGDLKRSNELESVGEYELVPSPRPQASLCDQRPWALSTDMVIFWELVVIKLDPNDFRFKESLRLPLPTGRFSNILWYVGLWIDLFASPFEAISSNTTKPGAEVRFVHTVSIFTHFFVLISLKLLKLGEIDCVKFWSKNSAV